MQSPELKSIHPFPARMAAEIAFRHLSQGRNLRVLDPMVGSGTTIAAAQHHGHRAVGFDMDPLAVLMTTVRCSPVDCSQVRSLGREVLREAQEVASVAALRNAYPQGAEDRETQAFIRYWFDATNRKQLFALSEVIRKVHDEAARNVLWCALSRTIIKKKGGASLAMDVSHSRPHRVADKSDQRAFILFEDALNSLLDLLGPRRLSDGVKASVSRGDARSLPLRDASIDLVVTSPPYLNAIDYLRGHRLSLVWMGHSIPDLREVRSTSIGSERGGAEQPTKELSDLADRICTGQECPGRLKRTLCRYLNDLDSSFSEMSRVLVHDGTAVVVIGNSSNKGVFIRNSLAVSALGAKHGLHCIESKARRIPNNRRYLPTPVKGSGTLAQRIRTETVLVLRKSQSGGMDNDFHVQPGQPA
jgi:DNA modification methylase